MILFSNKKSSPTDDGHSVGASTLLQESTTANSFVYSSNKTETRVGITAVNVATGAVTPLYDLSHHVLLPLLHLGC